jgi:hypothetical protein
MQAYPGWYRQSRYGFTGPNTNIWTSLTVGPTAQPGQSGNITATIYNVAGQMVCQSSFTIVVRASGWTSWLNRDGPGGSGDWETRTDFPEVCASPTDIQAQTTSGIDWTQTGEVLTVSPSVGLVCRNADQPDGICEDYQVRFFCP